jgi:hypothetical protein
MKTTVTPHKNKQKPRGIFSVSLRVAKRQKAYTENAIIIRSIKQQKTTNPLDVP